MLEVMRDLEFTFPNFNRTMIILTPDNNNIGRKRSKNFHDGRTVEQRSCKERWLTLQHFRHKETVKKGDVGGVTRELDQVIYLSRIRD